MKQSDARKIEPIFYHDIGAGRPLMLVHGSFSDGLSSWSNQMNLLSQHHRLLVVDRRGHGRSPTEPRPYTIAGDASDLIQVADLAGTQRFHLAGHSYGGLVALETARMSPQRILSLHLIEPPFLSLLPDDPDVAPLIEQGGIMFRCAGQWGPERTAAAFFELILGGEGLVDLQARPAWQTIVREARRIEHEEFPAGYQSQWLTGLRLDAPIQVYTGGRSNPGLRKLARRLVELLPAARLVDVPEATHAVQNFVEPFHRELLSVALG